MQTERKRERENALVKRQYCTVHTVRSASFQISKIISRSEFLVYEVEKFLKIKKIIKIINIHKMF